MAMTNCVVVIVASISCLVISFPDAATAIANPLPHVPHSHPPLAAAAATTAMPLINPGIQKICAATSNPKVCVRSLGGPYVEKGQTRVDPTWALVQQAHAGINATERAIVKAKKALNDPSVDAECVQVCLDCYDSVMDSWRDALTSLQLGNGFDVANQLSAVSAMTSSCEDAFSGDDPTVVVISPLTKVDRLILKMASNALAIQEMIFPRSN
ncbi:hypothetical protein RHGRI_003139 [Rhododendron griersonianum]|uniref:Pectinesterase inhibitor domain-containing protein n=1 Tax=Rhododendron griersonianum TaxID=479676 RepID=A0AAV6LSJ7_9ERIC|nr:hypothetical protein RHGRI_003139 [Rhododendron griersonianum]